MSSNIVQDSLPVLFLISSGAHVKRCNILKLSYLNTQRILEYYKKKLTGMLH